METIVVDSHNEVLPYWFKGYLSLRHPLVVVRIDEHHDMNHECIALPAREGRQNFDYLAKLATYISEYAIRELNEGNFTCPAFHYGIVGALYHYNPREREINAYGRVSGSKFLDTPKTKEKCSLIGGKRSKWILWDEIITKLRSLSGKITPIPQSLTFDLFRKDLEESLCPTVICFDLDGLYGIREKGPTETVVCKRLERTKRVLECITSPVFAGIARSQRPRIYVPPALVDSLQNKVLNLMEMTYA